MTTVRHTTPRGNNFERYAFLFMRLSGVALLFLAVGHMLIQHVIRDVHNLSLQVVADVWRSWGWRAYSLLLLFFAVIHGMNGLRYVLEDYIHNAETMRKINIGLAVFVVITIIWAAIAIFAFQPDAVMAKAH
jgi:succinate dehydrogenase / fumarate reductase, membrane anchor subunit